VRRAASANYAPKLLTSTPAIFLFLCFFFIARQHAEHDIDIPFPSVRPSVRYGVGLCLNECTYRQNLLIICQRHHGIFEPYLPPLQTSTDNPVRMGVKNTVMGGGNLRLSIEIAVNLRSGTR